MCRKKGCTVQGMSALNWDKFPATELHCTWPTFPCEDVLDVTSMHREDADINECKLAP